MRIYIYYLNLVTYFLASLYNVLISLTYLVIKKKPIVDIPYLLVYLNPTHMLIPSLFSHNPLLKISKTKRMKVRERESKTKMREEREREREREVNYWSPEEGTCCQAESFSLYGMLTF